MQRKIAIAELPPLPAPLRPPSFSSFKWISVVPAAGISVSIRPAIGDVPLWARVTYYLRFARDRSPFPAELSADSSATSPGTTVSTFRSLSQGRFFLPASVFCLAQSTPHRSFIPRIGRRGFSKLKIAQPAGTPTVDPTGFGPVHC